MDLDYEELGLKIGLEVHQQLDSNRKLFCHCPPLLRRDNPDVIIKRHLHPVAGETGGIDAAVEFESLKKQIFEYQGYSDSTCLLEYDESPPYTIDETALQIAIQIALILNCKILPIIQVMRKTVIDGSNTSGFQRTVLIAQNGFIETSFGRVGIATICLEEDAARIIDKEKGIFRLDRLGIPLVEIATDASIKNPQQAKEAALKIGEVLRKTKVKRGLGTIRQDVNLSIAGGKRIELKGFQDIRNIERAIEIEVQRQQELVVKGESRAEVRAVNPDGTSRFLRPLPGAARMYPETDLPLLKIFRQMIDEAKKTLPSEKETKIEGLNHEMTKLLLTNKKLDEFKEFLHILNKPQLIAKALLVFPKEIANKEKKSLKEVEKVLTRDILASVLERVKKGKVLESEVKHVLEKIVRGENHGESLKVQRIDKRFVEEKIMKIIKEKPGLGANAYMGLIMKEFQGKISGKEAAEIIKKYLK